MNGFGFSIFFVVAAYGMLSCSWGLIEILAMIVARLSDAGGCDAYLSTLMHECQLQVRCTTWQLL